MNGKLIFSQTLKHLVISCVLIIEYKLRFSKNFQLFFYSFLALNQIKH
jgi:hypothetical protein